MSLKRHVYERNKNDPYSRMISLILENIPQYIIKNT